MRVLEKYATNLTTADYLASAFGDPFDPPAAVTEVDKSDPGWVWTRAEWTRGLVTFGRWFRFGDLELVEVAK